MLNKKILKSVLSFLILTIVFTMLVPIVRANVWDEIEQNLMIFENEGVYRATNKQQPLQTMIARIIGIVLTFIGMIFLALTVYGGILWMTARGNDEQSKKARQVLTDSIIGVGIVVASYTITWFVVQALQRATFNETL